MELDERFLKIESKLKEAAEKLDEVKKDLGKDAEQLKSVLNEVTQSPTRRSAVGKSTIRPMYQSEFAIAPPKSPTRKLPKKE